MAPADESPERTFRSARARLDEILHELESDEADVDQLAARVKEASALLRFCQERLAAIRYDVKRVIAEMAGEEATPAREGPSDEDTAAATEEPVPPRRAGEARPEPRERPTTRPRDGGNPGALPF